MKKEKKTKRLVFHFKQSLLSHHKYDKFLNFYMEKKSWQKNSEKKMGGITAIYLINREGVFTN